MKAAFTPQILSTLFIAATFAIDAKAEGPNIVFILGDDVGWTDVSAFDPLHRGYYETPNIDRLATQGMRFTQAYANPTCTPTRAALMSGQYYPRQPVYDVGPPPDGTKMIAAPNTDILPAEKVTLAEALKSRGYATGFIGKWHIGDTGVTGPEEQGFDFNIGGYRAGNPNYWPGGYFAPNNNPKIDDAREGEYLTDYLTRKAVEFVENHKEKPFYLQLSYYTVHTPMQAPEERIRKYSKKKGVGGHDNATYAAMLESLDRGVGQVMETLDRFDLAENTILIFYSDNGGFGGYGSYGVMDPKVDITNNAPLRSGKNSIFEGGIRVPFIARWPGLIQPGSRSDEPVIHVDFYPTLLEATSLDRPVGYPLDGVSFLPILKKPEATLNREAIYWHFPGYTQAGFEGGPQSVIRSGPWKLFKFYEDGHLELYNINEDIGEANNLAENHPDVRDRLRTRLEDWLDEMNAPMPQAR